MASAGCVSCGATFAGEAAARDHYSGEWHSVNLQRRVADLPPLPLAAFEAHVAKREAAAAAAAAAAAPVLYVCDACNKRFSSEGPFETHIRTKKHVARVKELLAERRAAAAGGLGASMATAAHDGATAGAAAAAGATSDDEGVAGGGAGAGAGAGTGSSDSDVDMEDDGDGGKVLVISCVNCLFCFHKSGDIDG